MAPSWNSLNAADGVSLKDRTKRTKERKKGGRGGKTHTTFDGEAGVYVPFDGGLVLADGGHLERVPFSGVGLRGAGDVECDGGCWGGNGLVVRG